MSITGLNTNNIVVGDEVLYLDVTGEPYMNGVVKQVINIGNGEYRLNVLLDNGQYIYNNLNKFVKVWKMGIAQPKIKPHNEYAVKCAKWFKRSEEHTSELQSH